MKILKLFFHP